ncbi:TetR/AcrR family transcriptional regulator [Streptomyces sp. NPDC048248]|uniref:TetR/AcrR family transcriptional regulator n=1 Tax=Streptomyces sp. NPDC048248 TaxID=3365523 RepID=UPI00371E5DF3
MSRQFERGERILAAAGELLLAWGYRRVTIDEIARRAKVGKGTVYLHWKTKESLLLAVVLNSKTRSLRWQLERMRADPLEILPSRTARGYYRDFLSDPVLRAMHTDDSDILGRLNERAATELSELVAESHRTLHRHLEILRERGLVRDDTDPAHQQYALIAVITGFFMSEVLLADRAPGTPDVRSDILAHTIRTTLETPASSAASATALATAAAPGIIALYEHLERLSAREIRRRCVTDSQPGGTER